MRDLGAKHCVTRGRWGGAAGWSLGAALCVVGVLPSIVALGGEAGAERVKRVVRATIDPAHRIEGCEEPVGNVRVTYEDGAVDLWTLKGNCMRPTVSARGTVGWIVCELDQGGGGLLLYRESVPVGSQLRLNHRGEVVATIRAAMAFIEQWSFEGDGAHVVIVSRAAHGPATVQRCEVFGGKEVGRVQAYEASLPAWAEPFAER